LFALIALGCIAAAMIFAFIYSSFLPDMVPVHRTGRSARASIEASGVKLPASATDLHYDFESQFSTYRDTWISFSASASDCMSAARAFARTQAPAPQFVPGTQPGLAITRVALRHWDLSAVKNGMVFETGDLFVLIDTDANTVYITLRADRAR
jgi:hypothetical protein